MHLRKNYTHEGKVKTLHQWSKIHGIPYNILATAIRTHGDIAKAIADGKTAAATTKAPKTKAPKTKAPKEPKIAYIGNKLTAAEWSKVTGIKESTIKGRIKRGWTLEKTFGF